MAMPGSHPLAAAWLQLLLVFSVQANVVESAGHTGAANAMATPPSPLWRNHVLDRAGHTSTTSAMATLPSPSWHSHARRLEGVTMAQVLAYFPADVKEIIAPGMSISGELPHNLSAYFPELTVLDLSGNKISGVVPSSLWELPGLVGVSLANNDLHGQLSGVGAASQLQYVNFDNNKLSGPIPAAVGSWPEVQHVSLMGNQLSGPLPDAVGSWHKVRHVHLAGNQLSGPLPDAVGSWHKVQLVGFGGNRLSGPIPDAVRHWHEVQAVFLLKNQLRGPIPDAVGSWHKVQHLHMSENQLSGPLPDAVGSWREVQFVNFSHNQLSGLLPDAVGSWHNVQEVYFHHNQLSGRLPGAVGNWQSVTTLKFYSNQLSGPIPSAVGSWHGVKDVEFDNNQLSGPLPSAVGSWHNVRDVRFNNNQLSGPLPSAVWSWQTTNLDFSDNRLTGLPSANGTSMLSELDVRNNMISHIWELPKSLKALYVSNNLLTTMEGDLGHLEIIDARDNQIRGMPQFKVSSALKRFSMTNNPLSIDIDFLGVLLAGAPQLIELACRNCSLTGTVDPVPGFLTSLSFLPSLVSSDLSMNRLTSYLHAPTDNLKFLDLSQNDLHSVAPELFNIAGNYRISTLAISGNPNLHMPVQSPRECDGSGSLSADLAGFKGNTSYECTTLCPGPATSYVHDSALNVSALCRCRPGFAGHSQNCTRCEANTYSSEKVLNGRRWRECLPCPSGSSTDGPEKSALSDCKCDAGSYMSAAESSCIPCPQFPFRTTQDRGAQQVAACGCNPTYAGLKEADGRCGCDEGKFLNIAASKCMKCSNSEQCDWGIFINKSTAPPRVKPGFWAEAMSTPQGFAGNSIWRCASKETCLLDGQCAEGREGRACGLCQANTYGPADGPCEPCPADSSPEEQRWSMAAGIFAVLVPGIIVLHLGLTKEQEDLGLFLQLRAIRSSVKQTIKHLQNVSVISGFSVTWPPVAKALFESLNRIAVTIKIPTLVPTGCLYAKTSASQEMYAKWATPLIFVICLGLAMPISWVVSWVGGKLAKHCPRTRLAKKLPAPKELAMTMPGAAKVLLFSMMLFWSTLVSNSMEMITCIRSPNGKLTVATYPHLQCSPDDPEFLKLSLIAATTMIFYLVIPMLVLIRGYNKSREQLAASSCERRGWYSFIFDDFRDNHMVWSLLIMAKDTLCVVIPATMPSRGAFQLLLTAALCSMHAVLIANSSPFKDRSNSLLEVWNGATAAGLCFYSVGMGYESTDGMEDVSNLFEEGTDDPVYQQRAIGMVVVQIITFTVPAAVLIYQLLCSTVLTARLVPRKLRPMSDEEAGAWVEDVSASIDVDGMAAIIKKFDSADLHVFKQLIETSSAVIGFNVAKHSLSSLVQKAESLRDETPAPAADAPRARKPREGLVEI